MTLTLVFWTFRDLPVPPLAVEHDHFEGAQRDPRVPVGEGGAEAKITVGPFIMVEKQDFIACELTENVRLTDCLLYTSRCV